MSNPAPQPCHLSAFLDPHVSSQPVLRRDALRRIEQEATNARPVLMERAGQAAAGWAQELLTTATAHLSGPPLILAGPGNNGGDAFVVARRLKEAGHAPQVIFTGNADTLPADARQACQAWQAAGGSWQTALSAEQRQSLPPALIIDGLFGIGLSRPLQGAPVHLIDQINELARTAGCPVLALDLPSGLDSETGQIHGVAIQATHTLSFIALKPGLLTLDGPDICGQIRVHDLDLGARLSTFAEGRTLHRELFARELQPRRRNTHKGCYGSVGILGGARSMAGAALLAGRAALALGAGRVHIGLLEPMAVDPLQPELMLHTVEDVLPRATCLAVGPGLGQSEAALAVLQHALDSPLPLLLDADALNLLASHPALFDQLPHRQAATLLTPHPSEAARLLHCDTAHIQNDRLAAVLTLARRCHAITLLKGCGSLIALPDGAWYLNTSGNAGLATAGSGDVLSGLAIGLLAQGWPAAQALLAAVHLHGLAADVCVAAGHGPLGLRASDLILPARSLLNHWISG
ncbi:MAG: NAD(P)H-hydrate dehydratase [Sterolibacterium sp.]|nr:NAD(P)H-hydrate dehydratase [Sterolibacterium sp.]MBP9800250.1 NAD(P)H-hydrate dehydratase [Sterolibacterium sp.]